MVESTNSALCTTPLAAFFAALAATHLVGLLAVAHTAADHRRPT
jgi:hypothetical protein